MMPDIIAFVVIAILVLGGLVTFNSGYGLVATILGFILVAAGILLGLFMAWFLGWFAQRVDGDKQVAASYAKINTPETTTNRRGNTVDSDWTTLTKSRTDYHDDH